ncbi:hypothetical protein EBR25_13350 [bacterium]|nr:hypothetical protein [bacterium]
MSRSNNTEFRMYLVVTGLDDRKVLQRYRYTKEDAERLCWEGPNGIDWEERKKLQVEWLREQGVDLVEARVYDINDNLPAESWDNEAEWWENGYCAYSIWPDENYANNF